MVLNPLVKKFSPSKEEVEKLFQEIVGNFTFDISSFKFNSMPEVNELVAGKVIGFRDKYVLVDLGCKTEGYLPAVEEGFVEDLDIEDKIHVIVKAINSDQIFLTRVGVELRLRKTELSESLTAGEIVRCKLLQYDKGNWTVLIEDCLEGVMPHYLSGINTSELDSYLNAELDAEIESIENGIFTLSRKAIAERERKLTKETYLSNLEVGMIVEGVIKNLTNFGSFIQLVPGVFGLCHISDHGKVPLSKNQRVKAKVLKIDRTKNKIALSIKQATEPTWEESALNYRVGDVVQVLVKSLVNYGAFVELECGLQGLLHISDLSWAEHVGHPKEVLNEGDTLEVVIIGIDSEKKRISLGLKQLTQDPWELVGEKYLVGSKVVGKVNKNSHGLFIELEKGIQGLLVDKKNGFQQNSEIEVYIKKIDLIAKKIYLTTEL